jgi:small subunit ribosomal protein S1
VSLSLKATQEDPWRHFARTHAIGQVVPGKVTKLVPFGAFVRVQDGIEGLVHISELAERHVEIAEQVVATSATTCFVKVIDIDLERRRISLSLKQANEGLDTEGTEFDPSKYGMVDRATTRQGNYIFPEGFDADTNEWLRRLRQAARKVGARLRGRAGPLGAAQEAGCGFGSSGRHAQHRSAGGRIIVRE